MDDLYLDSCRFVDHSDYILVARSRRDATKQELDGHNTTDNFISNY